MLSVRPVEPPQRQLRRALLLLEELEDDLRVLASNTLPRRAQVRSLLGARRRVWLAMAALVARPNAVRSWAGLSLLPRKRAAPRGVPFEAAALVAWGLAFLVRAVWWS